MRRLTPLCVWVLMGCNALSGIDAYGTGPGLADTDSVEAAGDADATAGETGGALDTRAEQAAETADDGTTTDAIAETVETEDGTSDGCVKNPCGGCSVLSAKPGDVCDCGGTLACAGTDSLACSKSTNACGGCSPLVAKPGDACDACGGGWACKTSTKTVVCVGACSVGETCCPSSGTCVAFGTPC